MRKLGHREVITKATQQSVEELGFQVGILASKHLFRLPALQPRCTALHRGSCLKLTMSGLQLPTVLVASLESLCCFGCSRSSIVGVVKGLI